MAFTGFIPCLPQKCQSILQKLVELKVANKYLKASVYQYLYFTEKEENNRVDTDFPSVTYKVTDRVIKITDTINFLSLVLGMEPQLLWCD